MTEVFEPYTRTDVELLAADLQAMFRWSTTPQGAAFWGEVRVALLGIAAEPSSTPDDTMTALQKQIAKIGEELLDLSRT